MLDFSQFKALSFDCYGTLIDWETGVLEVMSPLLAAHGVAASDGEVLELFDRYDQGVKGPNYRTYRENLGRVVGRFGRHFGFSPSGDELGSLAESLGGWQPFDDTVKPLAQLNSRYKLAIISNIDDDLFAQTAERLGVAFDQVITAQQVESYKPAHRNFEVGLERLGIERQELLHVAQSVTYDIVPAGELGLSCIWVRRKSQLFGGAAAGESGADMEVADLAELVAQIER